MLIIIIINTYKYFYLQDFQLNDKSYEDHLLLNQVEVLNVFCKDGKELLLNILLKEVLTINAVNETAVINNEIDKIPGY